MKQFSNFDPQSALTVPSPVTEVMVSPLFEAQLRSTFEKTCQTSRWELHNNVLSVGVALASLALAGQIPLQGAELQFLPKEHDAPATKFALDFGVSHREMAAHVVPAPDTEQHWLAGLLPAIFVRTDLYECNYDMAHKLVDDCTGYWAWMFEAGATVIRAEFDKKKMFVMPSADADPILLNLNYKTDNVIDVL